MTTIRWKRALPVAVLIASSLALAACSSSSSTPVGTHPRGVPYLTKSGSGNKTISSVDLPSTWSLVWKFSCTNPATRRPFTVAVSANGGPSTTVTHQTGLEGGGYHPFTKAGSYTFTVTTTCAWTLLVGTAGTQTFPVTTHTSTP
jgi:hypothetical protein